MPCPKPLLIELAASITEKRVLEPIIVRPNGKAGKYEVVAGGTAKWWVRESV
ncbi:MAG: ParB N-terminal domain-containing protein [Terriglobia bacterium]